MFKNLTPETLRATFDEFNREFFEGSLAAATELEIMYEDSDVSGVTGKHGGMHININDGVSVPVNAQVWDFDFAYTLLHEMVHAFIYQGLSTGSPSAEGTAEARDADHDACFFTKLIEVVRARGHSWPADRKRYDDATSFNVTSF